MQQGSNIKVLIAESSSFARLVMSDMLSAEPDIEVVDTAEDGEEVLEKIMLFSPDVLVMDVEISRLNRMATARRVKDLFHIPVIVSGSEDKLNESGMLRLIEECATSIVVKPKARLQPQLRSIKSDLISKIHEAMQDKNIPAGEDNAEWTKPDGKSSGIRKKTQYEAPSHLVIIGASTGGATAIEYILSQVSKRFSGAIIIAQHMPGGFTSTFSKRLDAMCSLPVLEAENGIAVESGKVYVAPGDTHIVVNSTMGNKNQLRIDFYDDDLINDSYDKPSIDLLMRSAVSLYKDKTIGVILSGLGRDGTDGARAIRSHGGLMLAQSENSSKIFGMAKVAIENGYIHKVLDLKEIPTHIDFYVSRTY